jgi:3D (Asp-Asp-Asp) domain-containing protein
MRTIRGGRRISVVLLAVALHACASVPVRRGTEMRFTATAYCDRGVTRSGTQVREGVLAADPALLPLGSVVRIIEAGDRRYERTYSVMDTGARVRGRRIDLYVRSCDEARRFGVRRVSLEVVRLGSHR